MIDREKALRGRIATLELQRIGAEQAVDLFTGMQKFDAAANARTHERELIDQQDQLKEELSQLLSSTEEVEK